jgi:glycerol kinase
MAKEAGVDLQYIHADGGAVNNRFLMQFVSDMLGIVVRASTLPELSALGAVFCGYLGMKNYTSLEDLRVLQSGFIEYSPSMNLDQVIHLVAGWQAAVQQVLFHHKQG